MISQRTKPATFRFENLKTGGVGRVENLFDDHLAETPTTVAGVPVLCPPEQDVHGRPEQSSAGKTNRRTGRWVSCAWRECRRSHDLRSRELRINRVGRLQLRERNAVSAGHAYRLSPCWSLCAAAVPAGVAEDSLGASGFRQRDCVPRTRHRRHRAGKGRLRRGNGDVDRLASNLIQAPPHHFHLSLEATVFRSLGQLRSQGVNGVDLDGGIRAIAMSLAISFLQTLTKPSMLSACFESGCRAIWRLK